MRTWFSDIRRRKEGVEKELSAKKLVILSIIFRT